MVMKQLLFATAFIGMSTIALGQDTRTDIQADAAKAIKKYDVDTVPKDWKLGGIFNLTGAQTSLNNWAGGGDKYALSINAFVNGHAYYKKGKHSWDNNVDLNFGYINTTSLGARKNDDRIDLLSRYGYALNKDWDFGALFNFRTQALKGYDYTVTPKKLSSNFLSPAYALIGPGFTFHPEKVKNFSLYLSPATARLIIVNDDSLSAVGAYGVDSGKKVKVQLGAYLTANYKADITSTLSYIGRVDLFSDYLNKPQNVYFYMTNMFALKISKVLSATWNFNLIYDDKARLFGPSGNGARMQTQSIVGAGLLYKF